MSSNVATPSLVDSLVGIGLTMNRARTYVSMLELRAATAMQLAERSGVPRTRIYEALEWLERAGFCSTRGERTALYVPTSPEVALGEWRRLREQERLAAAANEERLLSDLLTKLPRPEAAEPLASVSFMEAVSGKARVVEAFEQMLEGAQERLDIVQAPPMFQPRMRWNTLESAAVSRGVHVRLLCTPDTADDAQRYERLIAAGGEARVASGLVLKLVIRDGVEAMVGVPEHGGRSNGYAVVRIAHPDLIAPLQLLFKKEWRRGKQLERP